MALHTWEDFQKMAEEKHGDDGIAMINRLKSYLSTLHASTFTTNDFSHEIGPMPASKQGWIFGAQEVWESGERRYRSLEFERALLEKLNFNKVMELIDDRNGEAVRAFRARDKKELFGKDLQDSCKAILWDVDLFMWTEPPTGQEPE